MSISLKNPAICSKLNWGVRCGSFWELHVSSPSSYSAGSLQRTHKKITIYSVSQQTQHELTMNPLGTMWVNWHVILKRTHTLPPSWVWSKLLGFLRKYSYFTWWVFSGQIGGYFLNVPTPYLLGTMGANWWALSKSAQNVPARYVWSELMGSFAKNSHFTWWVLWGRIGGYF